jgi:hypothetical protein
MNAPQVLVSRPSGSRVALLAGSPLDVDSQFRSAHARTVPSAPTDVMSCTPVRGIVPSDVRDLIDAAGPLSLRDIAGGLDVSTHEASTVVRSMIEHHSLSQDEWERYRLPSAYRHQRETRTFASASCERGGSRGAKHPLSDHARANAGLAVPPIPCPCSPVVPEPA